MGHYAVRFVYIAVGTKLPGPKNIHVIEVVLEQNKDPRPRDKLRAFLKVMGVKRGQKSQ